MTKLESAIKHGKKAKGRSEIVKHLRGKKLNAKAAIAAQCYDCMGYCDDGGIDCKNPSCSLYPYMPYNPNAFAYTMKISEEERRRRVAQADKMNQGDKRLNVK